jgi:SAM-dependent methyltransferase
VAAAGMNEQKQYFETRFEHDPRREALWRALWQYHFSRLISPEDCVLELGAGYGHFINQVAARRRIAIDQWEEFVRYLQPGVEGHIGNVTDLAFLEPGSVNFVFASNLFEHISQEAFASVLSRLKEVLAPGATLNIVQPNYYYAYREYFDDYTHRSVYTHVSICDFLRANGYEVVDCRPKFLPLTIKSRLPVSPLLIRVYLLSPWKAFGKQMYIRACARAHQ